MSNGEYDRIVHSQGWEHEPTDVLVQRIKEAREAEKKKKKPQDMEREKTKPIIPDRRPAVVGGGRGGNTVDYQGSYLFRTVQEENELLQDLPDELGDRLERIHQETIDDPGAMTPVELRAESTSLRALLARPGIDVAAINEIALRIDREAARRESVTILPPAYIASPPVYPRSIVPPAAVGGVVRVEGMTTPENERKFFDEIEETGEGLVEVTRAIRYSDEERGTNRIIDLDNRVLDGLTSSEKTLLIARMRLSNARARKQAVFVTEMIKPSPEISGLNKQEVKALLEYPGVNEAASLYAVLLANPEMGKKFAERVWRDEAKRKYISKEPKPEKGKVETDGHYEARINEWKKGQVKDRGNLDQFRRGVRSFLVTELGMDQQAAYQAEKIAYNFIFVSDFADSLAVQGTVNIEAMKNGAMVGLINPRGKMVGELRGGKTWPFNVFGDWAAHHRNRLINDPEQIPLPDRMFVSMLSDEDKVGVSLIDTLYANGMSLVSKGRRAQIDNLDIGRMSDSPFVQYEYHRVAPAVLIVGVVASGQMPKDKEGKYSYLIDAFNKLGTIDKSTRKLLFYLAENGKTPWLNPKKKKFEPVGNAMLIMATKDNFNQKNPDYYK